MYYDCPACEPIRAVFTIPGIVAIVQDYLHNLTREADEQLFVGIDFSVSLKLMSNGDYTIECHSPHIFISGDITCALYNSSVTKTVVYLTWFSMKPFINKSFACDVHLANDCSANKRNNSDIFGRALVSAPTGLTNVGRSELIARVKKEIRNRRVANGLWAALHDLNTKADAA